MLEEVVWGEKNASPKPEERAHGGQRVEVWRQPEFPNNYLAGGNKKLQGFFLCCLLSSGKELERADRVNDLSQM